MFAPNLNSDTPELTVQTGSLLDQVDLSVSPPLTGIVLGRLVRLSPEGPLVTWPTGPEALLAQSTAVLTVSDLDRQVALMFVGGSPQMPVVLGVIQDLMAPPHVTKTKKSELVAEDELTFRCGKASLTLRKDGKVLLRGTHLVSRSSGPNKIKGASVSIN